MCLCVLIAQLCTTLCDPMNCSQPGSSVQRILQARILELGAILCIIKLSLWNTRLRQTLYMLLLTTACESELCLVTHSCPLFVTSWTVALQAPLSMGILRARILEQVAMPSSRGSPNPGTEPRSPALQADSLSSEPPRKPMNTTVGSLSLLQGMFLNQESHVNLQLSK